MFWINKFASVLHAVPFEDESKKKRSDIKDNALNQWFTNFSEADELLQLAAARQQVNVTHLCWSVILVLGLSVFDAISFKTRQFVYQIIVNVIYLELYLIGSI